MTDTTDIEALVAKVNIALGILDKHPSEVYQGAILYRDLVRAIERQQAVVVAMRTIKEQEGKVCDAYETCSHPACQSSYRAWAIADAALAALDAEPEGIV